MKPLLIFQLNRPGAEIEMRALTNTILSGIENGALIIDSNVTVLSFDEEGRMNYCTQQAPDMALERKGGAR